MVRISAEVTHSGAIFPRSSAGTKTSQRSLPASLPASIVPHPSKTLQFPTDWKPHRSWRALRKKIRNLLTNSSSNLHSESPTPKRKKKLDVDFLFDSYHKRRNDQYSPKRTLQWIHLLRVTDSFQCDCALPNSAIEICVAAVFGGGRAQKKRNGLKALSGHRYGKIIAL